MIAIRIINSVVMTFPGLFLLTLMIALNHGLMNGQYGFTLADILVKFSGSNYVWFAASLSLIIGYVSQCWHSCGSTESAGASSDSTKGASMKCCKSKTPQDINT